MNEREILTSWDSNASLWTRAVRESWIASRRAGSDDAILQAILRQPAGSALDVGCGEGWLARKLAAEGWDVAGVDASVELIRTAQQAGAGAYFALTYEEIAADPSLLRGPHDAIVCNFALLGESLGPLLAALRTALAPAGRLLIQTVHPREVCGDEPYQDGWRLETFNGFGEGQWAPMPWYFRTEESWRRELEAARFRIDEWEAPRHPESGRPLSLLITALTTPQPSALFHSPTV